MTVHDKLAERLRIIAIDLDGALSQATQSRASAYRLLADSIEAGDLDDILGVREPTIEDVRREAARSLGPLVCVTAEMRRTDAGGVIHSITTQVRVYASEDRYADGDDPVLFAPTIAAAYAALRAMPDYEGSNA